MSAGQRVLVTGASGFVGRHLLGVLARQANAPEIVLLLRDPAAWSEYDWTKKLPPMRMVAGSVEDAGAWQDDEALDGITGIYHLAAQVHHTRGDTGDMTRVNIDGTENVLDLAAKHGARVVFMSTTGIVACFDSAHEWADEHSPYCTDKIARWPYYMSKLAAERRARALATKNGIEVVTVRAPVILGPGDHRLRSTGHVARAVKGGLPFLVKGGIHFIDVRDATEAIVEAMGHPDPQSVYHLTGTSCSHDVFFGMVESVCGTPAPTRHVPKQVAQTLARGGAFVSEQFPGSLESPLPDPVVVEMASCWWDARSRHAASDLGYTSRAATDTISDTVDWLLENDSELREASGSR